MWALTARSPRPTATDDLIYFCYGDDEDGGPDLARQMIWKSICRLRQKLMPIGWRIDNKHGQGYWLAARKP